MPAMVPQVRLAAAVVATGLWQERPAATVVAVELGELAWAPDRTA